MAGNATGERIRGSAVRKIVELAAQGEHLTKIATAANVSFRSVQAIVARESQPISARKSELADIAARIARQGYERLEDDMHKANYSQLTILAGVMTDKLIALTSEPANQINQHLHLHLNPSDMLEKFNDLVTKINAPLPSPSLMLSNNVESAPPFHESASNPEQQKAEQEQP